MNYDDTREPVDPQNVVLAVGIIKGWTSYIRQHPEIFDEKDVAAQPYMSRAAALVQDFFQGTPGTNAPLYPCDVPDSDLVQKLKDYYTFAACRGSARDRGVPTALIRLVQTLPNVITTT